MAGLGGIFGDGDTDDDHIECDGYYGHDLGEGEGAVLGAIVWGGVPCLTGHSVRGFWR